jgi:hypothetical protein
MSKSINNSPGYYEAMFLPNFRLMGCHHLHTNNILISEQYGFRRGIYTENAAFKLTISVFKPVNQKMHVGGIVCNLAKAFDCINHTAVLVKLHFLWHSRSKGKLDQVLYKNKKTEI